METGSFGWAIATDQELLVTNKGPATGWPMQSFRAEAFGRLSGLLFITRFLALHDSTIQKLHTYLDNTGVIARCHEIDRYEQLYPGVTKKSDADLIMAIKEVSNEATNIEQIETYHVKGHQDRSNTNDNLSRQAQLNIIADGLATSALDELEDCSAPPPSQYRLQKYIYSNVAPSSRAT